MTIKEMIHAEIDRLGKDELDQLYRFVKRLAASKEGTDAPGILAQLREIQFDGPVDFAANLDLYRTGQKRVEENLP